MPTAEVFMPALRSAAELASVAVPLVCLRHLLALRWLAVLAIRPPTAGCQGLWLAHSSFRRLLVLRPATRC